MNQYIEHVINAIKAILWGAAVGLGAGLLIALPIFVFVLIAGGIYWIWDQYIR